MYVMCAAIFGEAPLGFDSNAQFTFMNHGETPLLLLSESIPVISPNVRAHFTGHTTGALGFGIN